MALTTDLTRRLGLRHPIIQAPLAGGGDTPELVAAVLNAGALGFIGAAYLTPVQIASTAAAVVAKTSRPFGINLFAPQPARESPSLPKAMIARLGPDEFLVTGFDVSVRFHVPGQPPFIRSQVLTAEEGGYVNGEWKGKRLWNGDEVDRGISFHQQPTVVRIRMGKF